MSGGKVKVLASGAVLGCFSSLSQKLQNLQASKAGPFDVCFCVGPFFDASKKEETCSILDKTIKFPLPVYFIDLGSIPEGVDLGLTKDDAEIEIDDDVEPDDKNATKIADNLYYLAGPANLVSISDIVIAYAPPHTSLISNTPLEKHAKHPSYIGCDIFISSEWPQGINAAMPPSPSLPPERGSYDISELTSLIRPRYHISSSHQHDYRHFSSLPFRNMSINQQVVHVCRFISLGNVLEAAEAKRLGKERKFLHAVGIVSLTSMTRSELEIIPNGTVSHPFADDGPKTSTFTEAQARRIMLEESSARRSASHHFSQKRKCPPPTNDNVDETNRCLFVHGLNKDPGKLLNGVTLLQAFKPFNCSKVRLPPGKSYGFIEFDNHADAKQCLVMTNGGILVHGINLTLNWSTTGTAFAPSHQQPTNKRSRPPPPSNSTSLFTRLPPTLDSASYPVHLERIRSAAQKVLEDAMNDDCDDDNKRITASSEPSLAVSLRQPSPATSFGFIGFKSHAAAAMVIAMMTESQTGGNIVGKFLEENELGTMLYWATGGINETGGENDTTGKECWFCIDKEQFEHHLVITKRDGCYVTMPKGAIDDFHSLIVPYAHDEPRGAFYQKEVIEAKNELRLFVKEKLKKVLLVFERAMDTRGGYHPHLQCVPIDEGENKVGGILKKKAEEVGFELKEVDEGWKSEWGYFYAEVWGLEGDECQRYAFVEEESKKVPLQFGREVAAEALGRKDKASWKACTVGKEKEEELTEAFKKLWGKEG